MKTTGTINTKKKNNIKIEKTLKVLSIHILL